MVLTLLGARPGSEDSEDLEKYQWIEVFQHCSAEITKMEPVLRSAQVLKQEAEEIGFEGKDILEYVKEQQKLDREERAAWREAQKMQAQANVKLAKI